MLVGEGNLSFAKSLLNKPALITYMTATNVLKKKALISEESRINANVLMNEGACVLHGVDATKIEETFPAQKFDTIIFQFPNAGSRDGKYGHTTNHVLIRKFLRSALAHLSEEGCVLITAVDNAYYNGMFKFEDAADFADYHAPHCMDFDPAQFSGYSHTNTNDDVSAIEDHKKFNMDIQAQNLNLFDIDEQALPEIDGLEYTPDFISAEEESTLFAQIDQQPWLNDLKRRVQHYGYKYDYKARTVTPDSYLGELPEWLMPIIALAIFQPDQAIVSEYLPGPRHLRTY